jgi:hypothetical protein
MQCDPRVFTENCDHADPRSSTVKPEPPPSADAASHRVTADPRAVTDGLDRVDPHDLVDRSELRE